jgi:protein O-GlcNAc transferase
VLTCPGEVYVARMGASLCAAVGLPELICSSVDQYVQRAIELGNEPEKMRVLKEKLVSSLVVAPLFQPRGFVQNLEVALREIWQRFVN